MALRRLRRDDTVMVIAGKERGKTGKVLRVLTERDRVVIERINLIKRHTKPRGVQQPGGIVEKEASVHLSNVLPICPRCNKPTRIGHRRTGHQRTGDAVAVRVCRRCGETFENP